MFCPPALTQIPSGQRGSAGLSVDFLDLRVSCQNMAAWRGPARAWALLLLRFLFPLSTGVPFVSAWTPQLTHPSSFPAPLPNTQSPLEGLAWKRSALGLEARLGMFGQRTLGPHALSKKGGAMLFTPNS